MNTKVVVSQSYC